MELLVVVGIIAVLVGIILPTAMRVRVRAKIIQDTSNIRTFTQACLSYASEHQGALPIGEREQIWQGDDIIWIRRTTYDMFVNKYGLSKEVLSCNGHWDEETYEKQFGSVQGTGEGTFMGWIYFGGRSGADPRQYPSMQRYVFPRRLSDAATSRVLATCWSYVSHYRWDGYLPHQPGSNSMLTLRPVSDPSAVSAAGMCVAYLDGSAAWVPWSNLVVLRDYHWHWYDPN